jgi:polyisoprenoid-binding protein YceI
MSTRTLEFNPEKTKIEWTLGAVLHTVHGTFKLKRGSIDFDTDTGKASGQVVVDVASGYTGNQELDQKMHATVLESRKYPEAFFVPDRILGPLTLAGSSSIQIHGIFTIHGAAHEITVSVQAKATADQLTGKLVFDIPYVAWGMKDPSNFLLKVAKTVRVSIETAGAVEKRY